MRSEENENASDLPRSGGILNWIRNNALLTLLLVLVLSTCGLCSLASYIASTDSARDTLYESCTAESIENDCEMIVSDMQDTYRSFTLISCAAGIFISAVIVLVVTMWKTYFAK